MDNNNKVLKLISKYRLYNISTEINLKNKRNISGDKKDRSILETQDFECPYEGCEIKFCSKRKLSSHSHRHKVKVYFPCSFPDCNKLFVHDSNHDRFLRTHKLDNVIHIGTNSKISREKYAKKLLNSCSTGTAVFRCNKRKCDQRFIPFSVKDLERHYIVMHPRTILRQLRLRCLACGQRVKALLVGHRPATTRYICHVCHDNYTTDQIDVASRKTPLRNADFVAFEYQETTSFDPTTYFYHLSHDQDMPRRRNCRPNHHMLNSKPNFQKQSRKSAMAISKGEQQRMSNAGIITEDPIVQQSNNLPISHSLYGREYVMSDKSMCPQESHSLQHDATVTPDRSQFVVNTVRSNSCQKEMGRSQSSQQYWRSDVKGGSPNIEMNMHSNKNTSAT